MNDLLWIALGIAIGWFWRGNRIAHELRALNQRVRHAWKTGESK